MSDKIRVGDRVYTNPANPVYGTVVLKVPKADGDPFRYRVHLDYMNHGMVYAFGKRELHKVQPAW